MRAVWVTLAIALGGLSFAAGTAHARVLAVASNGADTTTCGSASEPCRSVGEAIRRAAPGDTILVGPGRYGDVNANGALGEPGDESGAADCRCMILVDKRVAIVSRDGAYSTVLDASGLAAGFDVVRIAASGAVLGRYHRGFTIVNGGGAGVAVTGASDGSRTRAVRVEGNVLTRNGAGIRVDADASSIVGNVVIGNAGDALTVDGHDLHVVRTVAIANGQGVSTRADQTIFRGNAVLANDGPGFLVEAATENIYGRNVVVGNRYGFYMRLGVDLGGVATIRGSDIVGNLGDGIATGMNAVAIGNNIVGNGAAWVDGAPNPMRCGVFVDEGWTLRATQNYWGDRGGPAAPEADQNCSEAGAVVLPFHAREYRYGEGPRDLMP